MRAHELQPLAFAAGAGREQARVAQHARQRSQPYEAFAEAHLVALLFQHGRRALQECLYRLVGGLVRLEAGEMAAETTVQLRRGFDLNPA